MERKVWLLITLSELKRICEHYQLSIDQLLKLQNESVLFQAPGMADGHKEFIHYLKGMLGQFNYFNSFNLLTTIIIKLAK